MQPTYSFWFQNDAEMGAATGATPPAATHDFLMISATKEAVDSLVAALESGHSEVLTAYLGAMAKFHTYSFGNVMLIARQKPDATNVAGLRTWNSLGRFVKRGEKNIFILAPMIGKRRNEHEAMEFWGAKWTSSPHLGFRV